MLENQAFVQIMHKYTHKSIKAEHFFECFAFIFFASADWAACDKVSIEHFGYKWVTIGVKTIISPKLIRPVLQG